MARKRKFQLDVFQRGGDKQHKAVLEAAADFFTRKLMSTRLLNTLTVRVELRKGVQPDRFGDCGPKSTGSKKTREFTVRVQRDVSLMQSLSTLAHEFVHVEQFARNRLQQRWLKGERRWRYSWEGKPQPELPWHLRPWEQEARRLQDDMRDEFIAWTRVNRPGLHRTIKPSPLYAFVGLQQTVCR